MRRQDDHQRPAQACQRASRWAPIPCSSQGARDIKINMTAAPYPAAIPVTWATKRHRSGLAARHRRTPEGPLGRPQGRQGPPVWSLYAQRSHDSAVSLRATPRRGARPTSARFLGRSCQDSHRCGCSPEQHDGHDSKGPSNQRGRSGYRRPRDTRDPAPVIKSRVRHGDSPGVRRTPESQESDGQVD